MQKKHRRGATLIEGAIVLSVLSVFLWSGLELSLAVIRYNSMSACARILAREASLHGERSSSIWGPATLSLTANNNHPAATLIASQLATLSQSEVTLEITWPDGGVEAGDRVLATVRCTHSPVVSIASWAVPRELSASSQMQIGHLQIGH